MANFQSTNLRITSPKAVFPFVMIIAYASASMGQSTGFTDKASLYGINYSYGFPDAFGLGCSFYDFNGDGLDDISFGNTPSESAHFYENTGTGFTAVSPPGIDLSGNIAKCLLWVDYDNDGDLDLSCNSVGTPMRIYRNNSGQFSDVSIPIGVGSVNTYSYAGAWADYNNDGALDHYAGNRDFASFTNSPNRLFRNNGNGSSFTDVAQSTFSDDIQGLAFQTIFLDYNKDGWPDIFIANDKSTTHNTLLKNTGSGFEDVSDDQSTGMYIDGMGTTVGDFTGNGYEDIYVTNTASNGGNILVRNNADETFDEVGGSAGVRVLKFGWGASFADFDNDGDLDLFVANSYTWLLPGNDPLILNHLYMNQGDGTFTDDTSTAISQSYVPSFGSAVGDINNDGYPDIMVMNIDGYNLNLWQNDGGSNHWVKFTLEGVTSNRMAVGSWVELYSGGTVQHRYTRCGTSYGGQNTGAVMFGLGQSALIDSVIVRWPGGLESVYNDLTSDSTYHLTEPAVITNTHYTLKDELRVYPNPTFNSVTIAINSGKEQIIIRDLVGNIISSIEIKRLNGMASIDLSSLAPGVYIVEIREQGQTWTEKIVRL